MLKKHLSGCNRLPADPLPDTSHAGPPQWTESSIAAGINTVLRSRLSSALYNIHALLFLEIKATVTCLSFKRPAAAPLSLYMLHIPLLTTRQAFPPVGSPGIRPLTLLQGHKHSQTIRYPRIWLCECPPLCLFPGRIPSFMVE